MMSKKEAGIPVPASRTLMNNPVSNSVGGLTGLLIIYLAPQLHLSPVLQPQEQSAPQVHFLSVMERLND